MDKEKQTYNPCDDCKHSCSRNNQESGMCKICELNYFIERVLDYREQTKWISVNERLPERNGRYITHCNIEKQSLVCILSYSKIGGFNEGTVTHWMPLPEPPKMKGGAE